MGLGGQNVQQAFNNQIQNMVGQIPTGVAPATTPTFTPTRSAGQNAPFTGLTPAQGTASTTPQWNVNTAAAQGLRGAMGTTALGMGYTPQSLASASNIAQYQNPYTQQVIDASTQDILRGAKMGMQDLSRQATQARAFGGSRHGIAQAELGRGVAEQLAQSSAGLRQAGFQQAQQMAQQDIANRLAGAQFRQSAAQQLGNLSNLGFGMGQTINQNLMQQGAQQQAMQQQLMDLAAQRYAGYVGAPAQSLGYVSAALGSSTIPQSSTVSRQPGLYDYMTMAANVAPKMMQYSDIRLKTNVEKVGDWKGVNIYRWEWNAKAKEIGADKFAEIGVIAQEVRESHPQAVTTDRNGYLVVNYDKIK